MAISETVTLKDGVSGPAAKAASAVTKLTQAVQGLLGLSGGGNLAGLPDQLSKIAASVSDKVAVQQLKGQQQAAAQAEKLAAADAMARNKAIASVIQAQIKRDAEIAKLEAKSAAESEKLAKDHAAKLVKTSKDAQAKIAATNKSSGPDPTKANFAGQQDKDPTEAFVGKLGSVEGAIAALADKIVSVIESIAAKMADLVSKGAEIAVETGTFRENTLLAFSTMLGSEERAKAIYDQALDLADKIGLSKEKVVADITKFMNTGMGENEALAAVKAIGDVTQVLGEGAGSKITNAITKMQALGKMDKSVISGLARSGVSAMDVYAKIAEMTGKKVADVQLAVKKGLIDSKTGIAAIEAVVAKKFGDAAEKAGATIPRILGDIQDEFGRLFDEITSGPGGAAVKDFLKSISDALTGAGGATLRKAFNDLFGSLGELVGGMFGKADINGTIDLIAGAIHGVAEFVKDMTPGIQGFFSGLMSGFRSMLPAIGAVIKVFGKFTSALFGSGADGWEKVGRGIAYFIGALVLVVTIVGSVIGAIVELVVLIGASLYGAFATIVDIVSGIIDVFSGIYDTIKGLLGFKTAGSTMGTDLINGLVEGITGGITSVVNAIVNMANKAIAAGKAAFQTHSPSQLFHDEIGLQVPAGVAQGIAAGTPGVAKAVGKMADVAYNVPTSGLGAPGSTVVPANGNGGGTTNMTLHFSPQIKVDGASTPEDARALGAAAVEGGREAFEAMMNEWMRRYTLQAA